MCCRIYYCVGQREHELRDVFDAVRYVARSGCAWRMIPGDLPPWAAVYQQFRRWLDAGVFEALVSDVQSIAREWAGRKGHHNENPKPFIRTTEAADILEKVKRARAVLHNR